MCMIPTALQNWAKRGFGISRLFLIWNSVKLGPLEKWWPTKKGKIGMNWKRSLKGLGRFGLNALSFIAILFSGVSIASMLFACGVLSPWAGEVVVLAVTLFLSAVYSYLVRENSLGTPRPWDRFQMAQTYCVLSRQDETYLGDHGDHVYTILGLNGYSSVLFCKFDVCLSADVQKGRRIKICRWRSEFSIVDQEERVILLLEKDLSLPKSGKTEVSSTESATTA